VSAANLRGSICDLGQAVSASADALALPANPPGFAWSISLPGNFFSFLRPCAVNETIAFVTYAFSETRLPQADFFNPRP